MLEYKTGTEVIDWGALMRLYVVTDGIVDLAKAGDLTSIQRAFRNSDRIVTAWDGDRLVGAGRMISDGVCYGWIHDMAVLPEYQQQGVGRGIVAALLEGNEHLLIGLRAAHDAVDFYQKLGFQRHETSFAKYPVEADRIG